MRVTWIIVAAVLGTVLVLVFGFGVPMHTVAGWVQWLLGALLSLACPLYFLTLLLAPGLGYRLSERISQWWQRLKGRRAEIDDLQRRISHLGKAHHMAQLADIYLGQGRHKVAAEWLEKAVERDPDLLDARYKLAICLMRQQRPEPALELLEQVHARKPDHDYGGAYLRLAQANERCGHLDRACDVYRRMLRFYPGHPEATYCFGRLLERTGDRQGAREQMRQVVFSVRNSPPFHRRRNRHWLWKARWWLWRRGA